MTTADDTSTNRTTDGPTMPACSRTGCTKRAWRWGKGMCMPHARATPGHLNSRVPSAPVTRHLQECVALGASTVQIARDLGVAETVVYRHLHGQRPTMPAKTAKTLMRATAQMRADNAAVPAWPTGRRLRSLRAAGWTTKELADALESHRSQISKVCAGEHPMVRLIFARRVEEFFAGHLEVIRPPSVAAKKAGWPLPIEWQNIDDPDEDPTAQAPDGTTANPDRTGGGSGKVRIPQDVVEALRWAVNTANVEHFSGSRPQGTTVVGERLDMDRHDVTDILAGRRKLMQADELERMMLDLGVPVDAAYPNADAA